MSDYIFDKDYYINEIKKYPTHTVAWITANWDAIFDESITPSSTDPPTILAQPTDSFSKEKVFKNFEIIDDNFPLVTDLSIPQKFSIDGIYTLFFIDTFPTPIERLSYVDYKGIYAEFQIENSFPYAREEPFISGLDYDGIYSFFKIKENTFPYPSEWVEPFNLNNIYCIFETDSNKFHGFPTPKLRTYRDVTPPQSFHITPDLIDTNLNIQSQKEDVIQNEQQTIYSQIVSPKVLDRDIYREEYLTFINRYWEEKGQPMFFSEERNSSEQT